MAIINFASFNQYEPNGVKSLLNTTTYVEPYFKGVTPRWLGHTNLHTSTIEVPVSKVIEKDGRPWQRINTATNVGSSSRSFSFIVDNASIDADLRIPGNIVCFSFKLGTAPGVPAGGRYMTMRAPSTTAVTAMTIVPNILIGANELRWIDIRITYNEDSTIKVQSYSNKDLITEFTAKSTDLWAVGVGTVSASFWPAGHNVNYGFYLNDFLTVVDRVDDEKPTGLIGPITIRTLQPTGARVNGKWTPPLNKTIIEALASKRKTRAMTIKDDETIHSDPLGGTMSSTFTYPEDEDRPILAIQESVMAKCLDSDSASLQWQWSKEGRATSPKTTVRRFNDGLGFEIKTDILTPTDGKTMFYPEDITGRGVILNSIKKTVEGD